MEQTSCVNELDDVVELLTMLEQLLDGRADASGQKISLRGFQLTLGEAKRRLVSARKSLANAQGLSAAQGSERATEERGSALALAARITKAPTPRPGTVATPKGRVRELKGNLEAFENTRLFSNFSLPADPELNEAAEDEERLFHPVGR